MKVFFPDPTSDVSFLAKWMSQQKKGIGMYWAYMGIARFFTEKKIIRMSFCIRRRLTTILEDQLTKYQSQVDVLAKVRFFGELWKKQNVKVKWSGKCLGWWLLTTCPYIDIS